MADASVAAAAVAEALSRFGRLDVLVNNAAILASNPLLETSGASSLALLSFVLLRH